MNVNVNRKEKAVKLSTLQIRDTFRRQFPLDGDCDFLLLGNNSMLTVVHGSGTIKDGGPRLLVLNINTGTIGSMPSRDSVVKTESELTITG